MFYSSFVSALIIDKVDKQLKLVLYLSQAHSGSKICRDCLFAYCFLQNINVEHIQNRNLVVRGFQIDQTLPVLYTGIGEKATFLNVPIKVKVRRDCQRCLCLRHSSALPFGFLKTSSLLHLSKDLSSSGTFRIIRHVVPLPNLTLILVEFGAIHANVMEGSFAIQCAF